MKNNTNNEKNNKKDFSCCKTKKPKKENSLLGIIYGIVPHIGCIMFIIGAILGATILTQFFRPFLMNKYVFHYLILLSIGFATLSSILYLRKNKLLSWNGIKNKKRYLSTMYGLTIGINLVLFFLVFPFLANVSLTGAVSYDEESTDIETFKISVNIPCPGHAPLITNELKTIEGVLNTRYLFPNNFEVKYDKDKTSIEQILELEVFNQYSATLIKN